MRIKSFKFNGEDKVLFWCCFDIRRVMGAMLRTYQITMGRAYYKCTLRFSSTSNVTDTLHVPLPYVATLFFTLPSLYSPYLGRYQNGSQQRTVARTRRPLPEPASDG